ncbi:hypothetical protein D3C76_360920 [compost metagenome]
MLRTFIEAPFAVKLLILLHAALGLGAIFGGGALIVDPTGEMLGMPIDMMKVDIFPNFLIPGIILLIVLGIGPLAVMVELVLQRGCKFGEKLNALKPMHWSWTFSLYTAFGLLIWIMVQMYILETVAIVHLVYVGWALAIQIVTLLPSVREYYEPTANGGK